MIRRNHFTTRCILLIISVIIVCCVSVKGTLSLDSSLSNMCVNTFSFSLVLEPTDEQDSTNQDTTTTDTSTVNTNTKTNDDTMINYILLAMLISIAGLAICWTKENENDEN